MATKEEAILFAILDARIREMIEHVETAVARHRERFSSRFLLQLASKTPMSQQVKLAIFIHRLRKIPSCRHSRTTYWRSSATLFSSLISLAVSSAIKESGFCDLCRPLLSERSVIGPAANSGYSWTVRARYRSWPLSRLARSGLDE
ncbi:hypothetical protein [Bradyrhizobium sp. McL0615]|uniref:hypothetical protein n=1 Tax=Bradyrhizobium sp. McL0615 TaxID=3415673 RepID=UPI003CF7FEB0